MIPVDEKIESNVAEVSIPEELAIIPGGPGAVFPAMLVPIAVTTENTIKLIDDAVAGDKMVGVFAQRPGVEEPAPANIYEIGAAASIVKMLKMPDGTVHALLQGIARSRPVEAWVGPPKTGRRQQS